MSRYIVKDIPGADTRYRKYMVLLQALQREHPKILHTLKQKERSNAR